MRPSVISKLLSSNDTGETGGHQAGILIPKGGGILDFFPVLDSRQKNPRSALLFTDEAGQCWKFNFIYYNNRFFGGTRNEYRLTGMTSYLRQNNLKPGDTVILARSEDDNLTIRYQRSSVAAEGRSKLVNTLQDRNTEMPEKVAEGKPKFVVTGTWKVVKY